MMIVPISGSLSKVAKEASSWSIRAAERAFLAAGRFNFMIPTLSIRATRTRSILGDWGRGFDECRTLNDEYLDCDCRKNGIGRSRAKCSYACVSRAHENSISSHEWASRRQIADASSSFHFEMRAARRREQRGFRAALWSRGGGWGETERASRK